MTADVVAPRAKPRWWTFPRTRRYLAGFPPAGLTGALFFYCLSLTPSLLPRAWYLQAVMSAVTAAIGYGVGLFLGWVARSLIPWRPSAVVRRWARWALVVAAVVLIPLFGFLGAEWQHQIRELVEASQPSEAAYILVAVVTTTVSAQWPKYTTPDVPRPRSNQPALVWLKKCAASTRRSFGTTDHTTPPGTEVESQPLHGVTPGRGVNRAPERVSRVRQEGCCASKRIRVVPPSVIEARLSPFLGGTQERPSGRPESRLRNTTQ